MRLRRTMSLLPLVAATFFCVSGGPYGLEPVMQVGPGLGLLLILVVPLVWALPAALMTAELASAMPVEGGYVVWVRTALGPFWGFLCGWWTWAYTWVDVAIYPVLFTTYLAPFLEAIGAPSGFLQNPWLRWLTGLAMVVPMTWLNVRGVRLVGRTALVFGVAVLLPFVAMVLMGLPRLLADPGAVVRPFVAPEQSLRGALTVGLFTVLWNYLGWDSLSTIAGEVEEPHRAYPRSLAIAVPLITLAYLLPAAVGIAAFPEFAQWEEGTWGTVAARIGGKPLQIAVAGMGLVAAAGLFLATLLASSRVPFVLAGQGHLPPALRRVHPRYGTPATAVLASALVYSVLSFATFESLAELDVILYSAALGLEFLALVVLRLRSPELVRPFRIPGGLPVVIAVAVLPMAVVGAATAFDVREAVLAGPETVARELLPMAIALLSGPLWWMIAGRRWSSDEDDALTDR